MELTKEKLEKLKRGDLICVKVPESHQGSEQTSTNKSRTRPAVIIQNDKGNQYSGTVIIAYLTSHKSKLLPVHVRLTNPDYPVTAGTVILCEQVMTIDKSRIVRVMGNLDYKDVNRLNKSLAKSIGLEVA